MPQLVCRFTRLLISLLVLGLVPCVEFASAQQAATPQSAVSPDSEKPSARALKPRRSAEEIARWNDRTTPRRMLETFFFAAYTYDLAPEGIVNAIDCLDLSELGGKLSEGDAALMAHELNAILSRHDIALYGLLDDPKRPDRTWSLVSDRDVRIDLEKQADGRWRFSAATVKHISTMRVETYRSQRATQESRMKLAEGRTDPEATMRSFLTEVVKHDFTSAARCLDLRDIPPKLRAARGPELARKLAFVIQRCGFVFPQELISDPDGYRYVWHSNHRGRIMLDRVRQTNGQDAWLFSRGTVFNLDAMVEGFRNTPPDPRYGFVGVIVDAEMLLDDDRTPVSAPSSVPPHLNSARATLLTFLEGMDELDFDDHRTRQVLSCMDLGELSDQDRSALGLRRAAKLDVVLRHLNIDVLSVPATWEAETQFFGKEQDLQVVLARHHDGSWKFDADTVARVPDMFDRLSPEEKSRKDRTTLLGSARQAVRTLIRSTDRGDSEQAALTLDLDSLPPHARSSLGPVLAYKLKFLVNQIGPIQLQEVPNDAEGPRHILYRGPLGRISLEPAAVGLRKGQWLFTADTVAHLEAMYEKALSKMSADHARPSESDPLNADTVGILLHGWLPGWFQVPFLGLRRYQWIGLILIVATSVMVVQVGLRLSNRAVVGILRRCESSLGAEFVFSKLRPLSWLIALWLSSTQLGVLDMPIAFWGRILPLIELAWTGLLAWSALRLVDLVMAFYTNSESLQHRRNLSDMIVPTAVRFLKLSVLVVAITCVVYLIGSGEWVTRLLAGLGLVGLAASLAAQDTLKNFFGTLLLIGEHPFKLGDYIVVNGMEGTVESVGFRSTWLRTPDDSLITIPNSIIANASIDNRGARKLRRFRTTVSAAVDTPTDRLIALRDSLRAYAESHPSIFDDRVDIYIHTFSGSEVDLLINLYFKVETSTQELAARDELTRAIIEQARAAGVQLAKASRTLSEPHPAQSNGGIAKPKWTKSQVRTDSPASSR